MCAFCVLHFNLIYYTWKNHGLSQGAPRTHGRGHTNDWPFQRCAGLCFECVPLFLTRVIRHLAQLRAFHFGRSMFIEVEVCALKNFTIVKQLRASRTAASRFQSVRHLTAAPKSWFKRLVWAHFFAPNLNLIYYIGCSVASIMSYSTAACERVRPFFRATILAKMG